MIAVDDPPSSIVRTCRRSLHHRSSRCWRTEGLLEKNPTGLLGPLPETFYLIPCPYNNKKKQKQKQTNNVNNIVGIIQSADGGPGPFILARINKAVCEAEKAKKSTQ